jgi:hypothetical protein
MPQVWHPAVSGHQPWMVCAMNSLPPSHAPALATVPVSRLLSLPRQRVPPAGCRFGRVPLRPCAVRRMRLLRVHNSCRICAVPASLPKSRGRFCSRSNSAGVMHEDRTGRRGDGRARGDQRRAAIMRATPPSRRLLLRAARRMRLRCVHNSCRICTVPASPPKSRGRFCFRPNSAGVMHEEPARVRGRPGYAGGPSTRSRPEHAGRPERVSGRAGGASPSRIRAARRHAGPGRQAMRTRMSRPTPPSQ